MSVAQEQLLNLESSCLKPPAMNLLEQKRVQKRDEENRCVLNVGTPQTCLCMEISSEMANGCYRGIFTNGKTERANRQHPNASKRDDQ